MSNKYKPCKWCGDEIEIHHISLHQKICYLEPGNLQEIANYLITGIEDKRNLRRANFYRWSKDKTILSSISITARMKYKKWNTALYQLLVYSYLAGYISYEYVDVILAIISNGNMWMQDDDYKFHLNAAISNEMTNKGITDIDLSHGYGKLLTAVTLRAIKDASYEEGEKDEDNEPVDVYDAVEFLYLFVPEIVRHHEDDFSGDALQYLNELTVDNIHSM
jgi:hypothetical protein